MFEEIGPEFARLLALPTGGGEIDPSDSSRSAKGLRPGNPPVGQDFLRQAFRSYAAAFPANDHQGARGADAARQPGDRLARADSPTAPDRGGARRALRGAGQLRRALLRYLPRLHTGLALRLLLELLPGRSTSIKKLLDDLDDGVKRIAHEAVTEGLMTLALPGEVLSLARDVPGAFPADLRTIDNRELRALIARIVPTPDTTRGSGWRTGRT